MKLIIRILLSALVPVLFATGCASTPKKVVHLSQDQILQHEDVKEKQPIVFAKPIEQVRTAGMRALVFAGCEIQKEEPFYLSGRRPNKIGLFVGSGGETVEIFLYPRSPEETHVWIDTDLSFVGIAGQQSWNDKVRDEMTNILNTTAPTQ